MTREILDRLERARSEAYVTALTQSMAGRTIVGTLGCVPVELIWASGAWPIPLMSQDDSTLSLVPEHHPPLCDPLQATAGYAAADKCPLIHAASVCVVDINCPRRLELLPYLNHKKVYLYDPENEQDFFENWNRDYEVTSPELPHLYRKTRELLNKILQQTAEGQCSANEWIVIQNGERFIPDLIECHSLLSRLHTAFQKRPKADTAPRRVAISVMDGVDRQVLELLDACGSTVFVSAGCEYPPHDTEGALPFYMRDCIFAKGDEGTPTLSPTDPEQLRQLMRYIEQHKERTYDNE